MSIYFFAVTFLISKSEIIIIFFKLSLFSRTFIAILDFLHRVKGSIYYRNKIKRPFLSYKFSPFMTLGKNEVLRWFFLVVVGWGGGLLLGRGSEDRGMFLRKCKTSQNF